MTIKWENPSPVAVKPRPSKYDDLLNALRRADAAEDKLARIAQLLDTADATGMYGVGIRDIRNILDVKP